MARQAATIAFIAWLLASPALGCVFLYGDSPDEVGPPAGWDYAYHGDDWTTGPNGNSWTCTGTQQSPLNLPSLDSGSYHSGLSGWGSSWSFGQLVSTGNNIQVINTGHSIQVQWTSSLQTTSSIVTAGHHVQDIITADSYSQKKVVNPTPLQFHFHTMSEHLQDGCWGSLELHIVSRVPQSDLPGCPSSGCLTVTGVIFKVGDEDHPGLTNILNAAPLIGGTNVSLPAGQTIDINSFLPIDRSYIAYAGSLTTPPCTEGLLWQVFTQPQYMSKAQMRQVLLAQAGKNCTSSSGGGNGGYTRRLMQDDHSHFHHHTALSHRALLADPYGNVKCTIAAYGQNNRFPVPLNNRTLLSFHQTSSGSY